MSETTFITRDAMADLLEAKYSAKLTEQPSRNWRNVNTVVGEQAEGHVLAVTDFHFLELCIEGLQDIGFKGECEQGSQLDVVRPPGSISYVPPDILTEYEMRGFFKMQQIYIDKTVFERTAETLAPKDPDRLTTVGFEGIFDPTLKQLAFQILQEARRPTLGGEIYADTLAMQIAIQLFRRHLGTTAKNPSGRRLSQKQVAFIVGYIDDHLEEPGGLETLAKLVDMDMYSFAKAFKATTGTAPHQFLVERRLYRASDYIRTSKMPLSEIAYACGFSSQAHMTTTFSNQVGETPGAMRKAART